MRVGPAMVSGVLPDWHPLPGSDPPYCLCASCLSPLVHSFYVLPVSPPAPHPTLPPPIPMVTHKCWAPHIHTPFCSFIFVVNSGGGCWGRGELVGRGALLGGGWGRDYCSEHPVPRGPV